MDRRKYEEYLKAIYGMEFIARVTENGVPYGTSIDEDNENNELIFRDIAVDSNNELPF